MDTMVSEGFPPFPIVLMGLVFTPPEQREGTPPAGLAASEVPRLASINSKALLAENSPHRNEVEKQKYVSSFLWFFGWRGVKKERLLQCALCGAPLALDLEAAIGAERCSENC